MADLLTRRAVRHHLMRLRNARVAELRDERMPEHLTMHPDTLAELQMDGDRDEQHTLDFEGRQFMGIPLVTDDRLEVGDIAVAWPPLTLPKG
jgi:hypothetical protein